MTGSHTVSWVWICFWNVYLCAEHVPLWILTLGAACRLGFLYAAAGCTSDRTVLCTYCFPRITTYHYNNQLWSLLIQIQGYSCELIWFMNFNWNTYFSYQKRLKWLGQFTCNMVLRTRSTLQAWTISCGSPTPMLRFLPSVSCLSKPALAWFKCSNNLGREGIEAEEKGPNRPSALSSWKHFIQTDPQMWIKNI